MLAGLRGDRRLGARARLAGRHLPRLRRARARARPGDRPVRQLLQPGAVRRAHLAAVGPARRRGVPPARLPRRDHVPSGLPLRGDVGRDGLLPAHLPLAAPLGAVPARLRRGHLPDPLRRRPGRDRDRADRRRRRSSPACASTRSCRCSRSPRGCSCSRCSTASGGPGRVPGHVAGAQLPVPARVLPRPRRARGRAAVRVGPRADDVLGPGVGCPRRGRPAALRPDAQAARRVEGRPRRLLGRARPGADGSRRPLVLGRPQGARHRARPGAAAGPRSTPSRRRASRCIWWRGTTRPTCAPSTPATRW